MIITDETILTEAQDAIRLHLQKDGWFNGLSILSIHDKDLAGKLEETIARLGGLAVLISAPSLTTQSPNMPGPDFDDVTFSIRTIENVILNRNATASNIRTADQVSVRICRRLHHFIWNNKTFTVRSNQIIPDETVYIRDVQLNTSLTLAPLT